MSKKARHIECTIEEYHARPELGRSQAETARKSITMYHGLHVADPPLFPPEKKKCWDTGTVAHAALTSPGGLDDVVAVIPPAALNKDGHRKGAAWKDWYDTDRRDRIDMKEQEMIAIRHMIRNVYAHPVAAKLMAAAMHYEYTILYAIDGVQYRARPDVLVGWRGDIIVVDLKTTKAQNPREWSRDATAYGLHRQAAWYTEAVEQLGYRVAGFVFISVDKSPAHECRCYDLPEAAIDLGRHQIAETRRDLLRRREEDDWSDPLGTDLITIDLSPWAYSDEGITT